MEGDLLEASELEFYDGLKQHIDEVLSELNEDDEDNDDEDDEDDDEDDEDDDEDDDDEDDSEESEDDTSFDEKTLYESDDLKIELLLR